MPWLRLTRQDSNSERATARGLAAHLPFLLAPELDDISWPHRRLWDVRSALDFGDGLKGPALLHLCNRLDRILVTRDVAFLDDATYPPEYCPGLIVVDAGRPDMLDDFLVTIVGLLGPVPTLYRHVKVHGGRTGELAITAPEGRGRRVLRRFLTDAEGLPLLRDLAEMEEHPVGMR